MSEKLLLKLMCLIFGLTTCLLFLLMGCGTLSQYDIDSARGRIDRDTEPQAPFTIPGK
jgi:hypothetical protein